MNKKILALSVAAILGGASVSAFAGSTTQTATGTGLAFNGDGVGHILIQPYFTAQAGNATLINLVNTDTKYGKAVKVRFRSAGNSDDVLDFQVFLSPGDVWTASVAEGADGRALLTTADNTCTVPAIPAGGVSFITNNLPGTFSDADKANWTREGYVEFLNMGDIVKKDDAHPDVRNGAGDTSTGLLYTAIKHVNGTAPCTRSVLETDLNNNTPDDYLRAPTTGLMANWIVINVPSAASWSGESAALVTTGGTMGNIVYSEQNSLTRASGSEAVVAALTADPLLIKNQAVANFDLPDLSTPYVATALGQAALPLAPLGTDAVSQTTVSQAESLTAALAVSSVTNEFLTVPGIAGETDWVFSMPTRRYHVAYDYSVTGTTDARVFRIGNTAVLAYAPNVANAIEGYFFAGNTTVDTTAKKICARLNGITSYDQSENTATSGAVFSPGTVTAVQFCGEGAVVRFNGSDVLGASVATANYTNGYTAGWTTIGTVTGKSVAANPADLGLPVLGRSFIQATNANASAGVSGNFGAGNAHRVTR